MVLGTGLKKEAWPLPDPKGQGIEAVREHWTRTRLSSWSSCSAKAGAVRVTTQRLYISNCKIVP